MMKKSGIISDTLTSEVIRMNDERPATLVDLPTTVRGFCYHDDNGEEYVVVNARLTREQNRKTYDHIRRGDMYEPTYDEYGKDGTP